MFGGAGITRCGGVYEDIVSAAKSTSNRRSSISLQYGEMAFKKVKSLQYGLPVSTLGSSPTIGDLLISFKSQI